MTQKICGFLPGSGSGSGLRFLPGSGSGLKRIRISNTGRYRTLPAYISLSSYHREQPPTSPISRQLCFKSAEHYHYLSSKLYIFALGTVPVPYLPCMIKCFTVRYLPTVTTAQYLFSLNFLAQRRSRVVQCLIKATGTAIKGITTSTENPTAARIGKCFLILFSRLSERFCQLRYRLDETQ